MNYQPVSAGNRTNGNAGLETNSDARQARKRMLPDQDYIYTSSAYKFQLFLQIQRRLIPHLKMIPRKMNEDRNSTKRWQHGIGPGEELTLNRTNNLILHFTNLILSSSPFKTMEPKKVTQALDDEILVEAIQEELLQFKLLNVWTLVELPYGKKGHRQEEGIDYDEVFALVARIEAIRLFLAFASFMRFTVYQMDVKSAILYGTIEEEVYVNQPSGFVDPKFPTRVYKVEKALYGLHQAPRTWYETLSTYLMENRFRRGTIDKTLFIKKIKNDILLVQVYVDDIIFGSTKESLSTEFEQLA
ncbi:putative ribonuclease H-like domain-containing protein [Tanacetum coccineum]